MNTLAELLSSRVMAEVLRLLFVSEDSELHAREMARQAGLADATVRQELTRLARLEIIEARRAGNRTNYRANPKHPLYPDIRNLVLKTSGLVDVLRDALVDPRVQIAFVFGSFASGTAKATSDVDLMVIGTIRMRELSKLLSGVSAKLGREVNPHILTAEDLSERKKTGDHFLTAVLGSPILFVIGSQDELEAVGR